MRLPGPTEIFCLFDDARQRGPAPARLYRDPVAMIAAYRMDEVQPALDRVGEQSRELFAHPVHSVCAGLVQILSNPLFQ